MPSRWVTPLILAMTVGLPQSALAQVIPSNSSQRCLSQGSGISNPGSLPSQSREAFNRGRELVNQVHREATGGLTPTAIATYQSAREAFQSAIAIAPNYAAYHHALGVVLNTLGTLQSDLQLLEAAVAAYRRAIELAPSPTAYHNLGKALDSLAELERRDRQAEVLAAFDCAIAIDPRFDVFRTTPEQATAIDYVELGRVYRLQGRLDQALIQAEQAVRLGPDLATAHNLRGVVLAEMEQYEEAIASYREAIRLEPAWERYLNLVNALRLTRQDEEADRIYEQALDFLEDTELGNIEQQITATESNSSDTFWGQETGERYRFRAGLYSGDYDARAADAIANRMSLWHIKSTKGLTEEATRHATRALEISERARARALQELLASSAYQSPLVEDQLEQRERRLRQELQRLIANRQQLEAEIDTLRRQAAAESDIAAKLAERTGVQQEIRTTEQSWEALLNEIVGIDPDYSHQVQPPSLTLVEIQQLLDQDTLLLEYWLGSQFSYLWVISQTGIQAHRLRSQAEIEQAAERYYDCLTIPSQRIKTVNTIHAGLELSQMILEPIADQLDNKRLLIVADGALQQIPFGALPDPRTSDKLNELLMEAPAPSVANTTATQRTTCSRSLQAASSLWEIEPEDLPKPLLLEHEIVNMPSATILATIRRIAERRDIAPRTIALITDPELKLLGTQEEAQAIRTIAADEKFSSIEIGRGQLQSADFNDHQILHFATHGVIDDENPERSRLILSPAGDGLRQADTFLSLSQIFNLNLSSDLVVLSGCRTGLGTEIEGEGMISFVQSFVYAGTSRVIASLWSVHDEATAELMKLFYEYLLDQDQSPAAALRQAQVKMWESRQWNAPYYWAGFVLYGEWQEIEFSD